MTTRSSTEHPGALPVNWDSYWEGFMSNPLIEKVRFFLVKSAYQRLLKSTPALFHPRICELGAGTGKTSRFLGDTLSADITIVDNNEHALRINQHIFKGYAHPFRQIRSDVLDLRGLDEAFDLVHSGGLIEHFVNDARQRIIAAHARITKRGGWIIILVPVRNVWYKFLNEGIFKSLKLLEEIPEVPWSMDELRAALDRESCDIIATTGVLTEAGILARKRL